MVDCENLYEIMRRNLSSSVSCAKIRDALRVTTPLMYPDGDFISVYIEEAASGYYVTDAGELFHYLVANDIPLSPVRERILNDILLVNTAKLIDEEICAEVDDLSDLPFAIFRVAQSVARAADMVYSRRFRLPDTFNTSVSDFFIDAKVHFTEGYHFMDVYGQTWNFDFLIRSGHEKLVKTLATDSPQYAEILINRAIRQLDAVERSFHKDYLFTIYSDEDTIWKSYSLRQLEDHCIVIPFSKRNLYIEKLIA